MPSIRLQFDKPDLERAKVLRGLFRSVGSDVILHEGSVDSGWKPPVGETCVNLSGLRAELGPMAGAASAGYENGLKSTVIESNDVFRLFEMLAGRLGLPVSAMAFISYSRRDQVAADEVAAHLLARGYRVWVDRRDLEPSDEWLQALRQAIQASATFLFLASRTSVASPFCLDELVWAEDSGKRIIPVLLEPIPIADLPKPIQSRQWVEAFPDGIQHVMDKISAAVERDPKIVRLHQQILNRALEWQRRGKDLNLLLRGSELQEAEAWLGEAGVRSDPRPTELHSAYIGASRSADRDRRRKRWFTVLAVAFVTSVLAIVATRSAIEANRQRRQSESRLAEQRAYAAFVDWDADPVKSFLLADNATLLAAADDRFRPTYGKMTLSLSERMPELVTDLETEISASAVAADLSKIAAKSVGEQRLFITPVTGQPGTRVELEEDAGPLNYVQLSFNADGSLLAAITRPGFDRKGYRLTIWRTNTGNRLGSAAVDFGSDRPSPEVVGFSRDGKFLLLESSDPKGFSGRVVSIEHLDQIAQAPSWSAPVHFLLGQVDLASETIVQVRNEGAHKSTIELFRWVDGARICPPLVTTGAVRRAVVARGGRGLVAAEEEVGGSVVSGWVLEGGALRSVGLPLRSAGSVMVWDVSPDAREVLVIHSGSDFPAELWSFQHQSIVSVPMSKRVSDPFIMKAGEEYKPLSFTNDGRFIRAREPLGDPLQGAKGQQLLLYDRETLQLVAEPFTLSTDYASLEPGPSGIQFATISRDGLEETWDLLRRPLPKPVALPVKDLLLDAGFIPSRSVLVTQARVPEGKGYSARIDLWQMESGGELGTLPRTLPVLTKFTVAPTAGVICTAAPSSDSTEIQLWDLSSRKEIWSRFTDAPVESVAFLGDGKRVATVGQTEKDTFVETFESATGKVLPRLRLPIQHGSVHLAFSADGKDVIADYDYSSILIWDIEANRALSRPFSFSAASGLSFDLGYDLIRGMRGLRRVSDTVLDGELAGSTDVVIKQEGAGTDIVPAGSADPVLSAFDRTDARLYPVRGADLLSPSGHWFSLATNSSTVENVSAIRVYDMFSGYPASGWLLHQTMGRPGAVWPRLLTSRETEYDPILDVAFVENEDAILTITTNGLLRKWWFPGEWAADKVAAVPDLGAGLTARRLVSARYIGRVPQSEYIHLRATDGSQFDRARERNP